MKKLFTALILTLLLIPSIKAYAYTDTENHWAQDEINWVTSQNIMSGTGNNKFNPDTHVTRAQLVQIFYNMQNKPLVNIQNPFKDCQNHWALKAILWAKESNLVTGTSSTTFSPNTPVTQEQAVTIFYRYTKARWSEDAIKWAIDTNLITKSEPKRQLTRAEIAVMLSNYLRPKDFGHILNNTKPDDYTKYFDACDSTVIERQVMLYLTSVNYNGHMPDLAINNLWYDPRQVAKVTVQEAIKENTQTTKRMLQNPEPEDYFASIYNKQNLKNAKYIDKFWYHVIKTKPDATAKDIAVKLLSDPVFMQKMHSSKFEFYGIYIQDNMCCIAHGSACGP